METPPSSGAPHPAPAPRNGPAGSPGSGPAAHENAGLDVALDGGVAEVCARNERDGVVRDGDLGVEQSGLAAAVGRSLLDGPDVELRLRAECGSEHGHAVFLEPTAGLLFRLEEDPRGDAAGDGGPQGVEQFGSRRSRVGRQDEPTAGRGADLEQRLIHAAPARAGRVRAGEHELTRLAPALLRNGGDGRLERERHGFARDGVRPPDAEQTLQPLDEVRGQPETAGVRVAEIVRPQATEPREGGRQRLGGRIRRDGRDLREQRVFPPAHDQGSSSKNARSSLCSVATSSRRSRN